MKYCLSFSLALVALAVFSPAAAANRTLGEVIRDGVRDEIRDTVRDEVRESICERREERGRNPDLCNRLDRIDNVRDRLRRGRDFIRTIDAIF